MAIPLNYGRKIEFYLNGELFKEGPESLLIRTGHLPKQVDLVQGDIITLTDYPKQGISSPIQVTEVSYLLDQKSGQADTVKYFFKLYNKK